jgi:hypothetical protein
VALDDHQKKDFLEALDGLRPSQLQWVKGAILAFKVPHEFHRSVDSDIVTQAVLENLGDRLLSHHAGSRQALSKDRFEFSFEAALNDSGIVAQLVKSRTNRGHDITIDGVPVGLKTEAAANIKENIIHVSKWMELGKGAWELPLLRDAFLEHMHSYDRIFTLRCLSVDPRRTRYELVEIPKTLFLEAEHCILQIQDGSKQNPKPGYGYVLDANGSVKYSLYFDGGSERKLQIKGLKKELCRVHATWTFGLAAS